MSLRIGTIAIVASFLLCAATVATADGPAPDYSRPHLYIGGGFGGASDFLESNVEALNPLLDVKTGWSANVRVGYRAFSWFAIEGMYEGAYELDLTIADITFYQFDLHNLLVSLKFILPLRRFEPYFMLGFGAQSGRFNDVQLSLLDTNRGTSPFGPLRVSASTSTSTGRSMGNSGCLCEPRTTAI